MAEEGSEPIDDAPAGNAADAGGEGGPEEGADSRDSAAAPEAPEKVGTEKEGGAKAEAAPEGPGFLSRALGLARRWHPLFFLAVAGVLAAYAYMVYPESEPRTVPPADFFYNDGLDRLFRVINPDLPLIAAGPAEEALAARNAFLNLFVFHRENLREHPYFINPHLLLAEANRILAEFNPAAANRYLQDAVAAYNDALLWERREDEAERLAVYIDHNFLDGKGGDAPLWVLDPENEEVVLRRQRRYEYIRFRKAEADLNMGRPELARPVLEEIQRQIDSRMRDELRRSVLDDPRGGDVPRRLFELGPDEYRLLDLLLARTYDGLGQSGRARSWYLRYLDAVPGGRNHAFVVERLAEIALEDGELYRRVDPDRARERYQEAVTFFRQLRESPSATREQRDQSILGLALAYSRLAELAPEGDMTGVDELAAIGREVRRWIEDFSGQPLPRRTLALPVAVGEALSAPELILPGNGALPGVVAGSLVAMAGGNMATPHEQRRLFLTEALANFDLLAAIRRGSEAGDRAAVAAAREAWKLGLKQETEARFEQMLDPLSSPDLVLAARLGLAKVALDRGDLRRAHMLVLGGYAHPSPLWLTPTDADWRNIAVRLGNSTVRSGPGVWRRIWETLPDEGRDIAAYAASGRRLDGDYIGRLLRALNTVLRRPDFHVAEDFPPRDRNFYLRRLLERDPELYTPEDVIWRNRLLLEEALPYDLAQRAAKGNIGFEPFPAAADLLPGGLVDVDQVRDFLVDLAGAWRAASADAGQAERLRMLKESNFAYSVALEDHKGDPGEILYALARNYEDLAEIREAQGDHPAALAMTRAAALRYMDVALRARGSNREMDSLLAAGDAFFRSGLLERTVESQRLFLDRFGHSFLPGTDAAMAVVRAENLLGRAYWFLGDADSAVAAFRRNVPRRTPDRFKSIYYIGRVLMEEGVARNRPDLLGADSDPLPALDRNGDPVIETALQAFNYLRQSPDINPTARAWRWATFDLARLRFIFAEQARMEWEAARREAAADGSDDGGDNAKPWLALYDAARVNLTEALERYPLRRNGGVGISIRVEPEDFADTMAARFETEFMLAQTLLVLSGARQDEALGSLARAHLANLADRERYASALFDVTLDRFQLNSAVIREEVEGGNWDRSQPLPRTRLGDDEGPTRDPHRLREILRNGMLLLANEYFRAGERARERMLLAASDPSAIQSAGDAAAYYQRSYRAWQEIYDRFGLEYGAQAMVGMGDNLNRLGRAEDAMNHYRMARNMADLMSDDTRSDGMLNIGPAFWGGVAGQRLRDMESGYTVP